VSPILHYAGQTGAVSIPDTVHALDRVLNDAARRSCNELELNQWLRCKGTIKKELAALPPSEVDSAARAYLQQLEAQ
jgi:hypothetical protein